MSKAPKIIDIKGRRYKLTLFLINTRNSAGFPKLLTRIEETTIVSLAGGEEFMTAYVPEEMVE